MIQKINQRKKRRSFMVFIGKAMGNTSLEFYLAFSGAILQFIHILLAVAGTFRLFNINIAGDVSILLIIGEWALALILAYYLGFSLFSFTLKSGAVKTGGAMSDETRRLRKKKKKKYKNIVNRFQVFDTLIDLYFWIFIVFMRAEISNIEQVAQVIARQWPLLIVVIPVVVMLPQTLRDYTNEIEFDKFNRDREKNE